MKQTIFIIAILILCIGCSQSKNNAELKTLLLEQLKNSYSEQNWFVPAKTAINNISAQQANWKDSTQNHSIAELVSHITFWSEINLKAFKGQDMSGLKVNNETTFKKYTEGEWKNLVAKLDSV